ncbi:MAG: ATP synthase F0 subunit A [Planctomycetes bacterium RBG_13_63_9]|nr:MAG: ATP synthase F0 subunit A [Planctomycetes bacterium RBG_13_63_9]
MAAETAKLFGHVKDSDYFHVPEFMGFHYDRLHLNLGTPGEQHVDFQLAKFEGTHYYGPRLTMDLFDWHVDFQVTKFMVLEVVAALLMIVIFVWLARKIRTGERPRGIVWNLFEAMVVFLRDEVARPAIGRHDADRFLPYIWTIFFFILFCNLLGLVPWAGSPTGAWGCTLVLAAMTLVTVMGAGMGKYGVGRFFVGQVPHMDVPLVMKIFIWPMVFVIELFGMGIRHFVLSVRLLANMFAGHLVLAVILGFIAATADRNVAIWSTVMASSVFGAIALSLLELFVAFLQAYIFAFLSALFIGMAVHQH